MSLELANNIKLAKIMSSDVFKVRCINCQTTIESKFYKDYRKCSCGKIAIDGGKSKTQRRFMGDLDFADTLD
jgi:hypothetical protein